MEQQPFVIERTYNAPVEKVWKALTDKNQMKQWYFDLQEFKPEVGFEFTFYGQGHKGEQYLHICKITEVIPLKKLQYTWRYDKYEGNSTVTFELFEEGNQTRLKLTHEGLETFPANNPDFAKESFTEGWTFITGTALKEFVETTTIIKTTTIQSTPDKVWNILVNPSLNKEWAAAFSEGTYVETDWQNGSEVIWKTKEGDIGAKGKVVEIKTPSLIKVSFWDEINMKDPAPTGDYYEKYALKEEDGNTILSIESGPLAVKYSKQHEPMWDKAITKIKELAEN